MHFAFFPRISSLIGQLASTERCRARSRRRSGGSPGTLGELLAVEDILLDVLADGKDALLEQIGRHMESLHDMAHGSVAPALRHRERIGTTALGHGVAIPHARVAGLERIRPMYLRLKLPIAFDAPDGIPVGNVLVLLVPKSAAQQHLDLLAEASQLLSNQDFRDRLEQCKEPEQAKRLFASWPKLPA